VKVLHLAVAALLIAVAGCSSPAPQSPTPVGTIVAAPTETPPTWYSPPPTPTPAHTPWYSPSPTPPVISTPTPLPLPSVTPVPTATVTIIMSGSPTPYSGPQLLALSAYDFSRGAGVNLHIDHTDGQWGNSQYMLDMLESMMFGAVRTSLTLLPGPNNSYSNITNKIYQDGIDVDLFTNSSTQTPDSVMNYLKLIDPKAAKYIEGPNELDVCCNDPNYIKDDGSVMKNALKPVQIAEIGADNLKVIGPSLGFDDPSTLGDLTPFEDFVNMHDYMQAYNPDNSGYGGAYHGLSYGSELADIAGAQSVSTNPLASTEFGYSTLPNTKNNVTEYVQAAYLERQFLDHALLAVNPQFMYDLFDENCPSNTDGCHGVVRPDGSQKPSASGLQGMLYLLHDTAPAAMPCYVPVSIGTPTNNASIKYAIFCKSTGEYDIAIWQPVEIQNPNTLAFDTIPSTTVNVQLFNNPTSVVEWNQDIDFQWSSTTSPDTSKITPNERILLIAVNGPVPSGIPPLPTPPPTPIPSP